MNMTDIFNGIGNFFEWYFTYVKAMGNAPNVFFWLIIGGLLVTWLRMQANYNKEATRNNTLK
jgi:hypothetical protein